MDEIVATCPDLTSEIFADMDPDQSGDISEEELTAALESGLIANWGYCTGAEAAWPLSR